MVFPSALPYELIGKAVVAILAIAIAVTLLVASIGAILIAWNRVFIWVSNRMWNGYSVTDSETPPLWKVRVSGVTLALGKFKFSKVRAAYHEAEEISDNEKTFMDYAEAVFVSEDD